ncbi:MAG: putative prefoldin subunit 5 [Streblomastix strix]|uniref:Putative prefoldin subunit 5 n=1 Tax=Streblomastix strix TaxID=222440 RepID=A0A5J4VLV8_9EUKA|nr:MAG: putative prefoldin subunit 5 [Streblomastix strix]
MAEAQARAQQERKAELIAQLSIEQLDMMKQQVQEEVEQLNELMRQLRIANNKFVDSKIALNTITPQTEGQTIMIPVTSSLYVPGHLKDNTHALIDIGSNFIVRKSVEEAKEFFTRKIAFIHSQIAAMEKILSQKASDFQQLDETRREKLIARERVEVPEITSEKDRRADNKINEAPDEEDGNSSKNRDKEILNDVDDGSIKNEKVEKQESKEVERKENKENPECCPTWVIILIVVLIYLLLKSGNKKK